MTKSPHDGNGGCGSLNSLQQKSVHAHPTPPISTFTLHTPYLSALVEFVQHTGDSNEHGSSELFHGALSVRLNDNITGKNSKLSSIAVTLLLLDPLSSGQPCNDRLYLLWYSPWTFSTCRFYCCFSHL